MKYPGTILCLVFLALASACVSPEVIPMEPQTPEPAATGIPPSEEPAEEASIPTELVMPTKPAPKPPYTIGKPPPTFEVPQPPNPPDPNDNTPPTVEPARELMSEPQMEALVRDDLAIRLGVDAESIQEGRVEKTVWAEQELTCNPRKGLSEPARIPGYIIKFSRSGTEYVYHTDLYGRFIYCSSGVKPLDPIQ